MRVIFANLRQKPLSDYQDLRETEAAVSCAARDSWGSDGDAESPHCTYKALGGGDRLCQATIQHNTAGPRFLILQQDFPEIVDDVFIQRHPNIFIARRQLFARASQPPEG